MPKFRRRAHFWLVAGSLLASSLLGQTSRPAGEDSVQVRFERLEERIRQLETELAALKDQDKETAEEPRAIPQQAVAVSPPPSPEPQAVVERSLPMAEVIPTAASRSAQELSTETRLPVSGYMDYHFNKPEGDPGTADFHRFVLLFGHSFSDRIQFWSELEIEHAFVGGGEPSGELELEQAYLDVLVKPWLSPVGSCHSFKDCSAMFASLVVIISSNKDAWC